MPRKHIAVELIWLLWLGTTIGFAYFVDTTYAEVLFRLCFTGSVSVVMSLVVMRIIN